MRIALASRLNAIVAGITSLISHQGMIEVGHKPTGGGVAVIAGQGRCRMIDHRFSSGNRAIMAGFACAEHIIVINTRHLGEIGGVMTSLAEFTAINVISRFAPTIGAIMTIDTHRARPQLTVIHNPLRKKRGGIVASTA